MSTKPRAPKKQPPEPDGRWRIMRGDEELARYQSEELARARWLSLSRSRAGDYELKLLRPDGTVAVE